MELINKMKIIFFKSIFVDEFLKLALGGLTFLFMGCSTLQIPAGTNISPEISSKFVELGVDSTQTRILYLTESEDVGNTQITPKGGGTFRGGSIPAMYAAINVSDFFSLISESGGYKVQFQILGDSRQKAKPGNISVSAFGGQSTTKLSQYPVELANPAKYLISTGASDIPSFSVNSQI